MTEPRNVEDLDCFARRLDWNLLRTFMVILVEGSLTAAVNRLLRKQPTIGVALKRLEQTLDRRSLERGAGEFRRPMAASYSSGTASTCMAATAGCRSSCVKRGRPCPAT